MSRTVWKYPVELADKFYIEMPIGAQILSVQMQHDTPYLWALVDPDAPTMYRHFRLAGTGHPIHGGVGFIGTFQSRSNNLVFHLFEVAP